MDDTPETVEERMELLRDYCRLIAENPNDHLGILGENTAEHRRWADRAGFAAEMLDNALWDPTEAPDPIAESAADHWGDMREAVDAADDG